MINNTTTNSNSVLDTLYGNSEIQVPDFINEIDESTTLDSGVEQGHSYKNFSKSTQELFEIQVRNALELAEKVDPFEKEPPEILPSIEAIGWHDGKQAKDVRPFFLDKISNNWMLLDSGSMCSVTIPTAADKIRPELTLRAANNTSIPCYGYKHISVQIGRKQYKVWAAIADVKRPILGADFMKQNRLGMFWNRWGDLVLHDRKAKIQTIMRHQTLPHQSSPRTLAIDEVPPVNKQKQS